jgi:hypothetical protein
MVSNNEERKGASQEVIVVLNWLVLNYMWTMKKAIVKGKL